MIVAGEASGDLHGATLCQALKTLTPDVRLFGMGGRRMADAGVDVLIDVTGSAVVGGTEAVSRVPMLYRAYRRLRAALHHSRPAAVVLIDFPEFNLRLARAAHREGIPVVYFIPPQIWAWRHARVRTLRRLVSLVLAVFPFELDLYRRAGVPVAYVGHPVLDAIATAPSRAEARRQLGMPEDALVIGLLPGSRREEVERALPAMRDACRRIASVRGETRFVVGLAPTIDRATIEAASAEGVRTEIAPDGAYAVMRAADLLLVTSGTATLEAALLGAPMIVSYQLSWVSEALARLVIRVPWISLANIILGRAVVPEFYRKTATGERLAAEALRLLSDSRALEAQREAFGELAAQLGGAGVGLRAARLVLSVASAPSASPRSCDRIEPSGHAGAWSAR